MRDGAMMDTEVEGGEEWRYVAVHAARLRYRREGQDAVLDPQRLTIELSLIDSSHPELPCIRAMAAADIWTDHLPTLPANIPLQPPPPAAAAAAAAAAASDGTPALFEGAANETVLSVWLPDLLAFHGWVCLVGTHERLPDCGGPVYRVTGISFVQPFACADGVGERLANAESAVDGILMR